MKKADIQAMTDSELFAAFYDITVQLVKEANSRRGETKGSQKMNEWIVEESIKRFNLEREVLVKRYIIDYE